VRSVDGRGDHCPSGNRDVGILVKRRAIISHLLFVRCQRSRRVAFVCERQAALINAGSAASSDGAQKPVDGAGTPKKQRRPMADWRLLCRFAGFCAHVERLTSAANGWLNSSRVADKRPPLAYFWARKQFVCLSFTKRPSRHQ